MVAVAAAPRMARREGQELDIESSVVVRAIVPSEAQYSTNITPL
jgi:hypothetical protein